MRTIIQIALTISLAAPAALTQPRVHYEPTTTNLLSGQITVPAGDYYRTDFQLGNQANQRLSVSFNAAGGAGNDIIVVVMPASERPNWVNRHEAQVCYTTPGKRTTGKFEVTNFFKGVGPYVLIFGNRFSPLSRKFVEVRADFSNLIRVVDPEP